MNLFMTKEHILKKLTRTFLKTCYLIVTKLQYGTQQCVIEDLNLPLIKSLHIYQQSHDGVLSVAKKVKITLLN